MMLSAVAAAESTPGLSFSVTVEEWAVAGIAAAVAALLFFAATRRPRRAPGLVERCEREARPGDEQ